MKRDLVVYSTQYWDDSWFRKHQFAVRFARDGHRVFYVEPTHSLLRARHVAGVGTNPALFSAIRQVLPNVHVIAPARSWPLQRVAGWSRASYALTAHRVRRLLRRAGVAEEPLSLVYDARFASALTPELEAGGVVFELVDDLSGYADDPRQRSRARDDVGEFVRRSARVVYTSPELERLFPARGTCAVIPNGFDHVLFHADVTAERVAPAGVPVIGFLGTLFSFLDYELMGRVADAYPDAVLALVGRVEEHTEVDRLMARPNVAHVGYVAREQVPRYVAGFDVCIAPFRSGPVADAVSPLKLYEYLACGKPVVCTPMAGVTADPIGAHVHFAAEPHEFVELVGTALRGELTPVDGLDEVLAEHTWDALYARLRRLLGEELLQR